MSAAAPAGIDPDVWNTMTDEERAGMTDESYFTAGDKAALAAVAGDESDDSDDADDGAGGEDGGKTDDSATTADDKTKTAESADATPPPDDTATERRPAAEPVLPVYEAKLPDDYDDRVKANKEAKDSAWYRFDAGDLTREELQGELARLDAEGLELRDMKLKSEISTDMTAQTAEKQWEFAVRRNVAEFSKPEQGGIDYSKDEAKRADLDQFVKALANDPKNEDKGMDWFLQEAHKRVRALHGLTEPGRKPETPAEANRRRAPDLKSIPANLSQVPGGDGPGDVAGEFAEIDGLEGDEFEDAYARLTPAQKQRFAMGR